MLKKELKIVFTAIMFYTRIPVPKRVGYSDDMLNKSTRYLPLIGIVVGGIGAGIVYSLQGILGQQVAVVTAICSMVLLTGAFHEDAFADFCDGFGGGYTKDKILTIMKDSRIGTYGAVGLGLLFLAKYVLLTNVRSGSLPLLFVASHAFSRFMAVSLIYSSTYVGKTEVSKSKAIGEGNSSWAFAFAALFGLVPLWFMRIELILLQLFVQVLILLYFRYYVHKKIDGYTGDVLGALQQISEVGFYFSFLVFNSIQ
jgi:adenosylcobinamide-GDP ribazoletransferase